MDHGRIALVTGAAGGIGLAIARRLAAAGMQTVLVDCQTSVHDAASDIRSRGSMASSLLVDLGDPKQIASLTEAIRSDFGGCNVLVNNAGVHPKTAGRTIALEDLSLSDWRLALDINLTAPFLLCQSFLPQMKNRGWGRVVNIASRAGRTYSSLTGAHYSASKAGLIGLSRKLAGDYAATGVTVNCVAPGHVDTPMTQTPGIGTAADALRHLPIGRAGTPDEIASAVEYLCSDSAAFITGAVIDANGGSFIG